MFGVCLSIWRNRSVHWSIFHCQSLYPSEFAAEFFIFWNLKFIQRNPAATYFLETKKQHLVGGIPTPSEKYESQLGLLFHIYGNIKVFQTTNQIYVYINIIVYIIYLYTYNTRICKYIYIYIFYRRINASPWILGFVVLVSSKRTGLETLNPGVLVFVKLRVKRLDDWRHMMEMRLCLNILYYYRVPPKQPIHRHLLIDMHHWYTTKFPFRASPSMI